MPDPAPKGWADSARAFRSRKSARMAVRRFLKYLPCQGAGAILSKPDGDGWRSSPEGQTAERGAPEGAPALGVWVRVWFYLG